MALDWHILESNAQGDPKSRRSRRKLASQVIREPGCHCAMAQEVHLALMAVCGNLPLFRRAADYYKDALFSAEEVGKLFNELALFENREAISPLEGLFREALRRQCGVIAIAD